MFLTRAGDGRDADGARGRAALPGRQLGHADGFAPLPEGREEDQGPGNLPSRSHSARLINGRAEGEQEPEETRHGPYYRRPLLGGWCSDSFAFLCFSREPRTQRYLPLLLQALEEAEEQIQKEGTEELDGPAKRRPAVESNLAAQSDGGEEGTEEEKLLEVQQECRMTAIVQEALSKRDEVVAVLTER